MLRCVMNLERLTRNLLVKTNPNGTLHLGISNTILWLHGHGSQMMKALKIDAYIILRGVTIQWVNAVFSLNALFIGVSKVCAEITDFGHLPKLTSSA